MAGPTTEVLNEDLKELKADVRDSRDDMATLKAEVHAVALTVARLDDLRPEVAALRGDVQAIAVDLAGFKGEARVFLRIASWAGALAIASVVSGVWWASALTGEVRRSSERGEQVAVEVRRLADAVAKIEARATPAPAPAAARPGPGTTP